MVLEARPVSRYEVDTGRLLFITVYGPDAERLRSKENPSTLPEYDQVTLIWEADTAVADNITTGPALGPVTTCVPKPEKARTAAPIIIMTPIRRSGREASPEALEGASPELAEGARPLRSLDIFYVYLLIMMADDESIALVVEGGGSGDKSR